MLYTYLWILVEQRIYRKKMEGPRFRSFVIKYLESDIWIGIDPSSYQDKIKDFAYTNLVGLRRDFDKYIQSHPQFKSSLIPLNIDLKANPLIKELYKAGEVAQTGPMAGIAGAFAKYIGEYIISNFSCKEIVVENGGDIFMRLENELLLTIYAGSSPLSEKIGLKISNIHNPIGVCTSAGTVGPSYSAGSADAVMIACENVILADAFATSYGNKIKNKDDLEKVIVEIQNQKDILSAILIKDDKIAIWGKFTIEILKN